MRFVLNGPKISTPPPSILKVYTKALPGFSHIYHPDGLSSTLLFQSFILGNDSGCRTGVLFQGQGSVGGASNRLVPAGGFNWRSRLLDDLLQHALVFTPNALFVCIVSCNSQRYFYYSTHFAGSLRNLLEVTQQQNSASLTPVTPCYFDVEISRRVSQYSPLSQNHLCC